MNYRFALLVLGSLALIACGGDEDGSTTATTTTTTTEPDPEEHVCEHLADPMITAVAATADATMAPVDELGHETYEITLVDDGSGNFAGFMGVTITEGNEYMLYMTRDVPLAIQDAAGSALTVADDCAAAPCSEVCADIAGRYEATFAAATYTLSFGPTAESTFRLFLRAPHAH